MQKAIIAVAGVIGSGFFCTWNQSRLDRNDAMRRIPHEIKAALHKFEFKPTYAELKASLEQFETFSLFGISSSAHRVEFSSELDKQIRMASNGL